MENEQQIIAKDLISRVMALLGDMPDPQISNYSIDKRTHLNSESLTFNITSKGPGAIAGLSLLVYSTPKAAT